MDDYNNYTTKAVGVGTSSVELLDANNDRTVLILFNQGPEDILVDFGVPAAYMVIPSGYGINPPETPTNVVNARTASGSATITVMEA